MIYTFKDKATEALWQGRKSGYPVEILKRGLVKLAMLDAMTDLEQLKIPPSNRLEKLSGRREGQYSIRINRKWRICFLWENGMATEVEITDYH